MKKLTKSIFTSALLIFITAVSCFAQEADWRYASNGDPIYANGYCDQPYVVVLENGKWLCVFTTNLGHEGSKGQHIVSTISEDQGKTWSEPVRIEEPHKESASWALPYLTSYGRIYAFYSYNGDKIHDLREKKNIREDMIGWYCFKYSDDNGKTWSKRHRINIPNKPIDLNNDWKGDVQIFWAIGKPIDFKGGMMLSFTKVGQYMLEYSEGWLINCKNINKEKNPEKLNWSFLPEGDEGIKNPNYGVINSEQNIFQLNDGSIYCMHRTISGHPLESYSRDGGKSWSTPMPPKYENGMELKNPRACPRIWKCKNGKYLFWYHNNGGWDFSSRNPAWISGGIEKNGKIVWSQPEIVLYEEGETVRMSYPDLIEQDGKYWITETNKSKARCHQIPTDFLNTLWSQFDINTVATTNLVQEWKKGEIEKKDTLKVVTSPENSFTDGFTMDFNIILATLKPDQLILSSKDKNGKLVELKTAEFGAIKITIHDGEKSDSWSSDPGLIKVTGLEHSVSVSVDNGPKIVQFVTNGVINDGRNIRKFGWGRYTANMEDFNFDTIEIIKLAEGQVDIVAKVTSLKLYNRPLLNTEIIGNHNYFQSNQ